MAKRHWVIAFNNTGVGLSSGKVPNSTFQMAEDAIKFIKELGYTKVDLIGFSMGGMIAQEMVLIEPFLVRKLVLVGTAPRGGKGIKDVSRITHLDFLRSVLTFRDVKNYLFFPITKKGRKKAKEYLIHIKKEKLTETNFLA